MSINHYPINNYALHSSHLTRGVCMMAILNNNHWRFNKQVTGEHLITWLVAEMKVPEIVAKQAVNNPKPYQGLSEIFNNHKYNQYNSFLLNGKVYVDMDISGEGNDLQMIKRLTPIPFSHEILFTSTLALAIILYSVWII